MAPYKVRASSLQLGYVCPGAPQLLRTMPRPPQEEEDQLRWGSIAHDFLAIAWELDVTTAANWLTDGDTPDEFVQEMLDVVGWLSEQDFFPLWSNGLGHTEEAFRVDYAQASVPGHIDWCYRGPDVALVVDWKWGPGQRYFLPPIEDDLQMLAYSQCVKQRWPEVREIVVMRVLLTAREVHTLELDEEQLAQDHETLGLVVADIAERHNVRLTGPHCEHCLARAYCPERLAQAHESLALVPSEPALEALTDDQAQRYALARGALRERLDALDAALVRYLDAGGEVSCNGQDLRVSRYGVDRVVDHSSICGDLAVRYGPMAHTALRVTLTSIGEALQSVGKKGELRKLVAGWREKGWVRKDQRRQLRWRK